MTKNFVTKQNSITRSKPMMGTFIEVKLTGQYSNSELISMSNLIFDEIKSIEKMMSFYDSESELSYINQNAFNKKCKISDQLYKVLYFALTLSKATNGLYDISCADILMKNHTLPDIYNLVNVFSSWEDIELTENHIKFNKNMALDLGGIAKGYAVDKASEIIPNDVKFVINAGGDMKMNNWNKEKIHIKTLFQGKIYLTEYEMHNAAIATSNKLYQNNHIVNPKTKQPVQVNQSISVFAENCMEADALTKILQLDLNQVDILQNFNAKAILIDDQLNLKEYC